MPHCQQCGQYVTRDFVRVFGNNGDAVFGCLGCEPQHVVEAAEETRSQSTNFQYTV